MAELSSSRRRVLAADVLSSLDRLSILFKMTSSMSVIFLSTPRDSTPPSTGERESESKWERDRAREWVRASERERQTDRQRDVDLVCLFTLSLTLLSKPMYTHTKPYQIKTGPLKWFISPPGNWRHCDSKLCWKITFFAQVLSRSLWDKNTFLALFWSFEPVIATGFIALKPGPLAYLTEAGMNHSLKRVTA